MKIWLKNITVLAVVLLLSCSEKDENKEGVNSVNVRKGVVTFTDWPLFRGNPQLTGCADRSSELSGKLHFTSLWVRDFNIAMRKKKESESSFSTTPVIADDILFTGDDNGIMYALSCADGRTVWEFNAGSAAASAAVYDKTLFFGTGDGILFAISCVDGRKKWQFRSGGRIAGAVNIGILPEKSAGDSSGKQFSEVSVIFGSYDNSLYCLNASDGKELWHFKSGSFINGAAALKDNLLFFGGCDAQLRSLELKNGAEHFAVDAGSYLPASPLVQGKYCVAASYSDGVLCVDIATGQKIWTFITADADSFKLSPAADSESVYIVSENGSLYSLDIETGEMRWKNRKESFSTAPVITGEFLVAASEYGVIYLIRKKDGAIVDRYETGDSFNAPPALSGRSLFFTSEEGRVYALSLDN